MNESDHTIRELFKISEERERKTNCQRAAIFGAIFMMIGVCLDMVVYPELLQQLLVNRVITAVLLLTFAVLCGFIKNNALMRIVAHTIAMIPIVSIALMIFHTDGVASHYYGGLNLVLVGATLLLRWNTFDSAINVLLCLLIYTVAVYRHSIDDRVGGAIYSHLFYFCHGGYRNDGNLLLQY